MERLPAAVRIEESGDGHLITVTPGEEPEEELVSRLQSERSPLKPGDIVFERCPECGLPPELEDYDFYLAEGVITDDSTGRRMAWPEIDGIDAVFRELEAELGEDFARPILEAQRSQTRSALGKEEAGRGYPYLRRFFALRGMGNLVRYEVRDDLLEASIENARPVLLVAGILQGIYEVFSDRESSCRYALFEDGTLEVAVSA